jgi:acyl-CoA synthetase (AMP-forming)/AMP-acid ligase II
MDPKAMLDPILTFSLSTPNKIAISTSNNKITYTQLNIKVNSYYHYFKNKITENKIAISIQDPIEFIITFWALTRLGKNIFLLNPKTPNYNNTLLKKFNIKTHLKYNIKSTFTQVTMEETKFKIKETKYCIFTAGSTALPKCVIHSVNNFFISAKHVGKSCNFNSQSKWLLNLPLFHVSGLGIMFRSFLYNAELQVGRIQDFSSTTHISCVEKQLESLISHNFKCLQCILIGGSKISEKIINRALEKKLPIYKTYGLSETASAVSINKITKKTNHTSGKCLPHCKIKIKNKIIYIQSESLAESYLTQNNTKQLTSNNWFKTNDLGYFEKTNLVVTKRADSIIIINGENISLETIENTINTHQDVLENKMIAIQQNSSVILCCFINTKRNLEKLTTELNSLIKKELSSLFIPKKYFFLYKPNNLKHSKHELKIYAEQNYESADS